MKKVLKLTLIISILIFGIQRVNAEEYGIYCEYGSSGSFRIFVDTLYDIPETEGNDIFVSKIETAEHQPKPLNDSSEIEWLTQLGILKNTSLGKMWSCPESSVFGENIEVLTAKEYVGESLLENITTGEEHYTCDYSSGNDKLTISFDFTNEKCEYTITYPSNETKTISCNELSGTGNFLPSTDGCDDVYYVKSKNIIRVATGGNNENNTNYTLSGLCDSYNTNDIEHFCSGNCNYEELVCPYKCGSSTDIPAALPTFTHNIINIVKIIVPIMLVIFGMLDFGKAVTSNDEKIMKESQNRFIKRIIGAVAIFLVVAVTQFIFSMIGTDSTNDMVSCINCFINDKC